MIVAIDNKQQSIELVKYVKRTFLHIKILARAYDRGHGYHLDFAGADCVVSETFHSTLELGAEALKTLNNHPFLAEQLKHRLVETEKSLKPTLLKTYLESGGDNKYSVDYRALFMQLEEIMSESMRQDRSDRHDLAERSWTPPPKGYTEKLGDEH